MRLSFLYFVADNHLQFSFLVTYTGSYSRHTKIRILLSQYPLLWKKSEYNLNVASSGQ